jgi:ABC-2 type transport system permease protein
MPKRLLRLFSFLLKEILDVVQQPRLVATLIVGPFAILFVFGLGFIGKQGPVSAIVVVPPEAVEGLPLDVEKQIVRYRSFLPIRDVVDSREEAVERLMAGEVEMVVLLPTETYSVFLTGEQIVIEVLTNEYDPIRDQWLNYVGGFMATDLNEQLLAGAVKQGREAAAGLQGVSTVLLDRLLQVGESIDAGDLALAEKQLDDLLALLDAEEARSQTALLAWLGMQVGGDAASAGTDGPTEPPQVSDRASEERVDIADFWSQLREGVVALRSILRDPELEPARILDQVRSLRDVVVGLQSAAAVLEGIPDRVLVSPLTTEIENLSPSPPDYMSFYAPAVLALLLQHIALTFGALTMVHERLLGAEELFRVAPIAPWEIVTGKYASYGLLTMAVGLVLSVLLVLALGVPLLGSALQFLLMLLLVTAAGLGWGFLVSLVSKSESQAVQFSMMILIASVFFGGFFIDLSGLRPQVHFVSYALPVTYGVQAFREIMLAGRGPGAGMLLPLAGMGVGLYVANALIYTWQHKRE